MNPWAGTTRGFDTVLGHFRPILAHFGPPLAPRANGAILRSDHQRELTGSLGPKRYLLDGLLYWHSPPPSLVAVRTVALEILKSGPPVACLLACLLLAAWLLLGCRFYYGPEGLCRLRRCGSQRCNHQRCSLQRCAFCGVISESSGASSSLTAPPQRPHRPDVLCP